MTKEKVDVDAFLKKQEEEYLAGYAERRAKEYAEDAKFVKKLRQDIEKRVVGAKK